MQRVDVNSRNISHLLYQHFLLTVVLKTGERFIYKLLEASTFKDFVNSKDRDKFYKTHIEANKKFKRIQLLSSWD
ncbi:MULTISPECIES: KTSC domain-containing protein [unclassified Acinetobacter]|uniref:KTSC domain-containing protein n=1 Tax=unclassified Acinetobacter TaxID=196816 RepID=UPI0015D1A14C|nr:MULTISPECIES: KTSC domain-containing protein [unclassified Acinetobacter]UUS61799.1 KTSC domain-containing protein [Acinetobacter sp. YH16056_T]